MKIAFIGHGNVGGALAKNLAQGDHQVTVGVRENTAEVREKVQELSEKIQVLTAGEAVAAAEVIFIAVPFSAIDSLSPLFKGLKGKIVVDCTNPVGPGLSHGLESKISGSEQLQKLLPEQKVVKAFTIYGFENFQNSKYPGYGELRPAMLMAGDDNSAKRQVRQLVDELGFEPVDTGGIGMSLHLEHLTLLWIKMARAQGQGAGFTWARLTR